MPTIKVSALSGQPPLFDLTSYARRGPGRRDRLTSVEIALISRTVHRAPEVMVKVLTPGATTVASVSKHLGYVGRQGKLPIETDEGERLRDPSLAKALPEQWDLDLEEHRPHGQLVPSEGRKPSRLVHKLVLSMPAGTPPERVLRAAKNFLREEFALKDRYAFVLHTDETHPHVHVIVKAMSEGGTRLRIDKPMLLCWRQRFAAHLREEGIEANATARVVRGKSKTMKLDPIFRATRRGASTHLRRRVNQVVEEFSRGGIRGETGKARLLSTRAKVEAGWLGLSRRLQEEGNLALAGAVHAFVQGMPPARTEKEWFAHELLSRVHATREKDFSR